MNDTPLKKLEELLTAATSGDVPLQLRDDVLAQVRRELSAARWDRRLGRCASAILFVGIAMNAAMVMRNANTPHRSRMLANSDDALVRSAVAVADATDFETGRRYARQLAMFGGKQLTDREFAAIDAAISQQIDDSNL
jgi:hypothetical protein